MPSLEFTTVIGCGMMCRCCPQPQLKAAYGNDDKVMSLETFRTILAKLPSHVRVDFSGMAEPWQNPNCTEMLSIALREGYNVAIYTTLAGMDDGEAVAALLQHHRWQVEVCCVHLPDADDQMRGWKYSAEYEANLRRFIALRTMIPLEVMTMSPNGRIHPDLAHVGIHLNHWTGHTRAGTLGAPPAGQNIETPPHHETAVMCSFTPLYDQNVVLPNGDVVLCCMSYETKHKLGNLLEQEYYELFSGVEMAKLRAENMRERFSSESLCRTCNRARPLTTAPAARLFWT